MKNYDLPTGELPDSGKHVLDLLLLLLADVVVFLLAARVVLLDLEGGYAFSPLAPLTRAQGIEVGQLGTLALLSFQVVAPVLMVRVLLDYVLVRRSDYWHLLKPWRLSTLAKVIFAAGRCGF